MRRLLVVLGVAALLLLSGGTALAVPPLRLDEQVVDQVGALSGGEAQVEEALEELRAEDGTQLFVVFVNSFDGAQGSEWAQSTAELSQLGGSDALIAVAVVDGAYGFYRPQNSELSRSEIESQAAQDVEPAFGEVTSPAGWPPSPTSCAPGARPAVRRRRAGPAAAAPSSSWAASPSSGRRLPGEPLAPPRTGGQPLR
ncbi:TPM domain-containing protein [Blastococcus brunescens]|uniref:TPM domain-containing protein n=1 Tax=Blastococcus brunescens TaxID=1564165 RepID=A0ABZ1B3J7_9ACTN|nr:TPM domain-containing protein [Blastococcus sp. BMG 8361]WRL64428.1 TPM domain-containing protein [Blastococcus sp. BMG 8361]